MVAVKAGIIGIAVSFVALNFFLTLESRQVNL